MRASMIGIHGGDVTNLWCMWGFDDLNADLKDSKDSVQASNNTKRLRCSVALKDPFGRF